MNEYQKLIDAAAAARQKAYTPYSQFAVGAALLGGDGVIYTGCNVENASYGLTCCAERTALFKAVSAGTRHFLALAVVGGDVGEGIGTPCLPCGICRQALSEFCDDDLPIIAGNGEMTTLGELFPNAFRLER
ncbi:MAG: cytidine deaminase [Ruminococcaceae bacterium]|nr:cytidine deaminase [Oscillospiraceae bacterium]